MRRNYRNRRPTGNDRQVMTTLLIFTVSLIMWAMWRCAPYRQLESSPKPSQEETASESSRVLDAP